MLELGVWIQERYPEPAKVPEWLEPDDWLQTSFEGPQKEEWAAVLRSFRWHGLPPAQRRLLEAALRKDKIPPE